MFHSVRVLLLFMLPDLMEAADLASASTGLKSSGYTMVGATDSPPPDPSAAGRVESSSALHTQQCRQPAATLNVSGQAVRLRHAKQGPSSVPRVMLGAKQRAA